MSKTKSKSQDESGTAEIKVTAKQIEAAAEIAYTANRAYCLITGDPSLPHWGDAPDWRKDSVREGLKALAQNPDISPAQNHENWVAVKVADGWKNGPVKDARLKTHPCIGPWRELPAVQRGKDILFIEVGTAALRLLAKDI